MTRPKRSEQVTAIRDHALPLMRENGRITVASGIRILEWRKTPWMFVHRTPFGPIPLPYYYIADGMLAFQPKPNLGYSLDIWHEPEGKVLNIEWDNPEKPLIVSFKRGAWEEELFSLCMAHATA